MGDPEFELLKLIEEHTHNTKQAVQFIAGLLAVGVVLVLLVAVA